MIDEGKAKSTWLSLSFCRSSLSLPSCEEPKVWTSILPPLAEPTHSAKLFAVASNNDPGAPTCPNFIVMSAAKALLAIPIAAIFFFFFAINFIAFPPSRLLHLLNLRRCHAGLTPSLKQIHCSTYTPRIVGNVSLVQAHFHTSQSGQQHQIVEIAKMTDPKHPVSHFRQTATQ